MGGVEALAQGAGEPGLGVGAGGVEDHGGADVERGPARPIERLDGADAAVHHVQPGRLDMVEGNGTQGRGAQDEGQDQARRVQHLAVAEQAGAGEALGVEAREAGQGLGAGEEAGRGDVAGGVGDAPVAVEGEGVIEAGGEAEDPAALEAMAIGRDRDRQGPDQMRGDAEEEAAGCGRLPEPPEVAVLEVAQAAMDHLEGIGRGGAGEVGPLDQRHGEAALGRVQGGGGTEDATADHHQIEGPRLQRCDVALQGAQPMFRAVAISFFDSTFTSLP